MKKEKIIRFLWLLFGSVIFHVLFWQQAIGLNAVVFSVIISVLGFVLYPGFKKSGYAITVIAALNISALSIVLVYTNHAKVMYWISMILAIAYLHYPTLKAPVFAAPVSLLSFIEFPAAAISDVNMLNMNRYKVNLLSREIRIIIIPLIVVLLFFMIFLAANPVLSDFVNSVIDFIMKWFGYFLHHISLAAIFFFFVGLVVMGAFVYSIKKSVLAEKESSLKDNMVRNKKKTRKKYFKKSEHTLSPLLKYEFKAALYLIAAVNLLLLIVNIIDISWVWFGFVKQDYNLRQFVHEGTYLLILSILLSASIILYFFRRNLNFYPKYNLLKKLSVAWLVQNAVLTISVAVRNYHYIAHYGLAYKRVSLIIFLIMVLYGLYTVLRKITEKRTAYYLFRSNSWAIFLILIACTVVDWDKAIMKYNITQDYPAETDIEFLIAMPPKTLPVLHQNDKLLDMPRSNEYRIIYRDLTAREVFEYRKKEFIETKEKQSILSWNLPEYKAYRYLKNL